MKRLNLLPLALLFWAACENAPESVPAGKALYTDMSAAYTRVDFANDLAYDRDFNIYTYRNFYNGGGVGIADLNGDGRPDLYFSANQKPNRLYLNRGEMRFEDVTDAA